ncbi:MAG: DNA polymerase III subunit gamma/tau [Synergistes sp.]|nr:DNA polymerase III subunit gamma/tau [Synergistes sp.]
MYISLYRRYRPQTFSDMVGQSAAVGVLRESLRDGSLGHAYLFSGPRGCGKTSAARLVAKSLDCLNRKDGCEPCGECVNCRAIAAGEHLDVIEIDGASNRGINEIRDLKSHVSLKPLSASYKVYIIDEVHMLTDPAFNALLKTLEEPPANVVFLLATTEPHRVPVTIRSRCQHIPFHRITAADTAARLRYVCGKENIKADDEAVWEIARQADGALRDALSLTEQAVALGRGTLSLEAVRELTGGSSRAELEMWVSMLRTDRHKASVMLHSIMARGVSTERLCESLFVIFRDLWLYSLWGDRAMEALEISAAEKEYLSSEAAHWQSDRLRAICMMLSRLMPRAHYGMKGDVFSGLVFMEISSVINGAKTAGAQAPASTYEPAPPLRGLSGRQAAQTTAAAEAGKTVPRSVIAGSGAASVPAGEKQSSDALSLPNDDFSRLVNNLSTDRLQIASALISAEIYESDGRIDICFDRPCAAQNFVFIDQNRKNIEEAAAKTWGIGVSVPAEPGSSCEEKPNGPEDVRMPEAVPASAAATSLNAQSGGHIGAPSAAYGNLRALRRAGAEVLYIEKGSGEEPENAPEDY